MNPCPGNHLSLNIRIISRVVVLNLPYNTSVLILILLFKITVERFYMDIMLLFIINALFYNDKRSVPFICSCHISLQSTAAGESGARGALAAPRVESVFVVGTARVTHPGTLASGRVLPTRSVLITNASIILWFSPVC